MKTLLGVEGSVEQRCRSFRGGMGGAHTYRVQGVREVLVSHESSLKAWRKVSFTPQATLHCVLVVFRYTRGAVAPT